MNTKSNLRTTGILTSAVIAVLSLIPAPASASPMKARVIQQFFAQDRAGMDKSFEWTINELNKCDESLDIIVLPEFSEVPGKTTSKEDCHDHR